MAILGSIRHDGIISVKALVEEEPHSKGRQAVPMLYLHFPYCSGGNLITWMKQANRAPWDLQVSATDTDIRAGLRESCADATE
jgi:serine/threonine protein kinase